MPAIKTAPPPPGERLVPIAELPDWAQLAFPGGPGAGGQGWVGGCSRWWVCQLSDVVCNRVDMVAGMWQ